MNVVSLFSGIGGLDLGLERAGMTVVAQSEIDPYACRVLAKHWPDVPNLGDITTIDWSSVDLGPVDLVCGGYPCQPFSLAGVRRGDTDPRHLWPHFRDALRHLRPRWALLENVPGHLSLGFGRVLGDLAELGYDTEWDCIPAAAVGAPHLRYRVFVVAHAERDVVRQQPVSILGSSGETIARDDGPNRRMADTDRGGQPRHEEAQRARGEVHADKLGQLDARRRCADVADARGPQRRTTPEGRSDEPHRNDAGWQEAPGGPALGGDVWRQWAAEPDVGRVAHGVPHRVDRLRTLGNAVVPQVAELIGRRILEAAA